MDEALLAALYRFSWALTGQEAEAAALTHKVIAKSSQQRASISGARAREVALLSMAYQLFTGGTPLVLPAAHERIAGLSKLSLQHADALISESLLKTFGGLELPQRAALVLFFTTECSLHDIAAILQRTSEETVAIISRGKAEWHHILARSGTPRGDLPERDLP